VAASHRSVFFCCHYFVGSFFSLIFAHKYSIGGKGIMDAGKKRNKSKEDIKSIIGETYGHLGFDKLLKSAGIDSAQELAKQIPENLYEADLYQRLMEKAKRFLELAKSAGVNLASNVPNNEE